MMLLSKQLPKQRVKQKAGLNILIVDDDSLNQRLLNIVLARDNHEITFAYSGNEAINAINQHQFDLIFMGIGDDGHVASLFPEYDFEKSKNGYVEGLFVDKVGMNRVTLTLPVLNNAKNRLFGIIGKKKKAIFNNLLNYRYKNYPVARLLSSTANDIWVVN